MTLLEQTSPGVELSDLDFEEVSKICEQVCVNWKKNRPSLFANALGSNGGSSAGNNAIVPLNNVAFKFGSVDREWFGRVVREMV